MKMILCLALAFSVFATGCETTQQKLAKGYVKDPAGNWVRGDRPYFGDGKPWAKPGQVAYDPTVFNQAMAQNYGTGGNAAQPVIVIGPGSPPITTASTRGGTTVISTIGGGPPIGGYRQPYRQPPANTVGFIGY
jgi:hypothetical protein